MFLSKQIKFLVKIYLGSIEAYYFLPLMKLKSERLSIRRKIKLIKLNFPEIKNYYNGQKPEYQTFLVEELKNYKIKTISFSHGLAVNSPYLNYDVCYFFSRMQKRFFIGNFKTNYFKFDLSLRTNKEFYKRDLALVFIHQNIMTGNKTKLKKNYKTILQFIIKASNDYTLKVPVFIKFHPASTEKDKIPLGNISEIKRIEDLPRKYKFIAVTYFSTYVIELLDKMPFLIINPNDNLNLKFHFPWKDDLFVNNYIEFKRKIMELKDQKNYKDLWKNEMKYY